MPWGGNTREGFDVNAQYRGYEHDSVFIALCTFLVWIMVPGLAMFYAGLSRRKSALTMLFQAFLVFGVITLQWMLWGYSLAYAPDASPVSIDFDIVARVQLMRFDSSLAPNTIWA